MPPSSSLDGFWLPAHVRARVLRDVEWHTTSIGGAGMWSGEAPAGGAETRGGAGGGAGTEPVGARGIRVRWPLLDAARWRDLLEGLQRGRALAADELLVRWEKALSESTARLTEGAADMLPALADSTGYSESMLVAALSQTGLMSPAGLRAAIAYAPTWSTATRWETMPGLAGQVRFFPQAAAGRLRARLAARTRASTRPLCRPAPPVDLVLGYAAGNVPGTGFLMALLAGLANAADEGAPSPAVVVRNSRHEPLFTPWILAEVEAIDPELVAGIAVLVWDYDDAELQATLMRQAGLMVAAAGDDTIAALDALRSRAAPALRFHRHGHKASFAVIRDGAASDEGRTSVRTAPGPDARGSGPEGGPPAGTGMCPSSAPGLGALDSALWDQNGCLSARVHFVCGDAEAYALALTAELRALSGSLPRGSTPLRFTHRVFDAYVALAAAEPVRVCSDYSDDFAVVLDRRPWDRARFQRVVNACQGRSVVVRPVAEPLEAARMLRWIPADNLQSVSLHIDDEEVEAFAAVAGRAGVTAVRALGRAALPLPSYSWDGYLPLDLAQLRPAGHFTTVEFDSLRGGLDAGSTPPRSA